LGEIKKEKKKKEKRNIAMQWYNSRFARPLKNINLKFIYFEKSFD